ncbi:TetR/AcrR family transcriptional regulator [Streptomyces sp. GMY02]|uniref:TetR/AcrR family transcriptional regulator n=1 Tax=Streptomyces sp. GMY02 TaxID=1333528 RepID=UPI001C2B9DE2|nr:TetR/AcrR family transcriptional regulator [Streptomyces sp. GMY02]QXE35639.1 TetR/AcrR family transcriptional regulator [Streptomyces sp. GMY02]
MGIAAGSSPDGRAARSPNRRGEGTRLRADILAAATDLLDHGDERAVTLRAVARRAGIATPSIYPHFPDRSAIVLAVVRAAFGELSGRLGAAVDAAGDDPRQRLYAVCHAYLDFAAAHPERYRAMSGDIRSPSVANGVAIANDPACPGAGALRILAGILADCVAAGYSTSTDPFADAVALWLGLHGFAHQRAVTRTFPWPADLVRRFVSPLSHIGPVGPRTSAEPLDQSR